jgi:hypothetical protein
MVVSVRTNPSHAPPTPPGARPHLSTSGDYHHHGGHLPRAPLPTHHHFRYRRGALPPAPPLSHLHSLCRGNRPAAAAAQRDWRRGRGRGSGAVGLSWAEEACSAGTMDAQGGRGRLRRPRGRARRPGHRPRRRLRLERRSPAGGPQQDHARLLRQRTGAMRPPCRMDGSHR